MLNSFAELDLEASAHFGIHCFVSFALCLMEPLFKPWQYFPLCIHVFGAAEKRSAPDGNVACKLPKCYFWKQHFQNNCLGLYKAEKRTLWLGKVEGNRRAPAHSLRTVISKRYLEKQVGGLTWITLGVKHLRMNFNKWRDKQVLLSSAAQVYPSGISEEVGRDKASGWLLSNLAWSAGNWGLESCGEGLNKPTASSACRFHRQRGHSLQCP